jgi:hypothetical protein
MEVRGLAKMGGGGRGAGGGGSEAHQQAGRYLKQRHEEDLDGHRPRKAERCA